MHLRPSKIKPSYQSLFCPNNSWIIVQIVLIWSYTIESRFWNQGNCFTMTSYTMQYNLVPAKGRWCSAAGKVTAGLAESNGSLLPGVWLTVIHPYDDAFDPLNWATEKHLIFKKTKWQTANARTSPWSIYSKCKARDRTGAVQMLMAVYIGTTWQIRLNHPCAAAMRPYVKLLWSHVIVVINDYY